MQAAEELFTSRRLHEITLDDVARVAKVGKGTIYRYFKDKDDLFFKTASDGFEQLCELLRQTVPQHADFGSQLLAVCRHIREFFTKRRQLMRMMHSEEARIDWCKSDLRQTWMDERSKLVGAIGEIMDRGKAEGAVKTELSSDVLSALLLGMLRTTARELGNVPEPVRSLETVVDIFLNGIKAA